MIAVSLVAGLSSARAEEPPANRSVTSYAEIRVIDAASGRGVPLAEVETVNSLKFVTDNAGRIAFDEPGLMGRELFFTVRSHGYAIERDAFGYAGVKVIPQPGQVATITLTRRNIAERLCRLTGEGRYRDTLLVGLKPPKGDSPHPGKVAGQDSVQAAAYRGKVYWFWGDTLRMDYPLGLFRVAGATTPLFTNASPDVSQGIGFDYFVEPETGFARAMMPLAERPEGVVWVDAVCSVRDAHGVERLVAHYSRRQGLEEELEQGIAAFDDQRAIFLPIKQLPLSETWRRPRGHPIEHDDAGGRWLLFGSPNPNVRVPATFEAILDASQYEAFTCAKNGSDARPDELDFDGDGRPRWRWQKELPPVESKTEQDWLARAVVKAEHTRFLPADVDSPGERIQLHSGTVRWNTHRERWVLVACQIGGKSSFLGEVWYAEAREPTGPFEKAIKIATHDKQTFYNVRHHALLDRDGGRLIHFEGTYTNDFSGNPEKTPRYNYNQVLYRLDLDSVQLQRLH